MPDYIYNEKSLTFHIGEYAFSASVKETVQAGWKATAEKEEDDDGQEVGVFDEKACAVAKTEILNKKTTPPQNFSIDTLLSFMENPRNADGEKLAGLGTPATRATIIGDLFEKGYIIEEKKKLFVSEAGKFLLSQLKGDADLAKTADVGETTLWEKKLAEDPERFERETVAYVRACIKPDARLEVFGSIGKCPLCGRPVKETKDKTRWYCPGYKAEKPCNFTLWKDAKGVKLTKEDAELLLSGKKTGVKKCVSHKTGKPYEARLFLDADGKVQTEYENKK